MTAVSPDFVALCIAATVYALDRFGLLDRFKRRSPVSAAAEIQIAEQTVHRLRAERNQERAERQRLEQTRSLEPLLDQMHANAELQAQVLERLVHHNGSFAHMETSLAHLAEGLKLVTGFIAGTLELPVKP